MIKILNRRNLIRAAALIVAALVLTAGLEWLMLRTLPPIFTDMEVECPMNPGLLEQGETYLHSSGRTALKEEWYGPRLLLIFLMQLTILILLFPLGLGRKIRSAVQRTAESLSRVWREEKIRNWKLLGCFLLTGTIVFCLSRAWIWDAYQRDNWITHIVCAIAGICGGCLVTFRRTLGKKPEILFLILTLLYGGIMTYFLPASTQVALDDGFHFQHAMNFSMLGHVRFTQAEWDAMQTDNPRENVLARRDAFLEMRNQQYDNGAVYVTTGLHLDPKEYWMTTQGLGLFLGRVFHLRFWDMWSLGRFTGLLAYTLIGYFAIRRLKSGKMILALALMTPSSVFLASNYSYDPGVIAGIAISFSYWAAQWQERDQKLKNGDVAVMLGGMLTACYAKAIYFPILLIFLFLPKSKFRSRAHRRNFTLLILFAVLLVMLYILLPMAFSGGKGDSRGEGDVNTFGQVQYILSHPLEYALNLWHYLQYYLDFNDKWGLLSAFGYMGAGTSMTLIMIILAVATFTDQSEEGLLPPGGVRLMGELILFGTLILMITAMYVWFTAVGSAVFDGVQERYLIPFMYPAMAIMGSNRSRNQINPSLYNGLLFAFMLFAAFSGMINTCIEVYR